MREELENNRQEPDAEPSPTEEYRLSNKEALHEYPIEIRFLSRGCIVRVGCQEIAFESVKNAMEVINTYVVNPNDEQQKWRKILR